MAAKRILDIASNATCALIGIFLGLAIADFVQGSEDWLWRWQTIITGLLAIAAAGLTVVAMFATDSRSQVRHDQLVTLSLRSDRLRIERLRHGNAENLHRWAREIRKLRQTFTDNLLAGGGDFRPGPADIRNLEALYFMLIEILGNIDATKADDLFLPEMGESYRDLVSTKQALASQETFMRRFTVGPGPVAEEDTREGAFRIFHLLNSSEGSADEFADALDTLSETYEQFVQSGRITLRTRAH